MALWIPEFIDGQVYPASRFRRALADLPIGEGVVGTSYALEPFLAKGGGSGSGLNIFIQPGEAWVKDGSGGLYHAVNDAVITLPVTLNTSGLPRIDLVCLTIQDSVVDGGSNNRAVVQVLPGTPTAGATPANEAGLASLPPRSIKLMAFDAGNAGTTYFNTVLNGVDWRQWAHGWYWRAEYSAGDFTMSTVTTTPTIANGTHIMSSVAKKQVVHHENAWLRARLQGWVSLPAVANITLAHWLIRGTTGLQQHNIQNTTAAARDHYVDFEWLEPLVGPPARPDIFILAGVSAAGTVTYRSSARSPFVIEYREILKPSADNGVS